MITMPVEDYAQRKLFSVWPVGVVFVTGLIIGALLALWVLGFWTLARQFINPVPNW